MLIGYMGVSTDTDRQSTDLQKDALLKAGVDERHLFVDCASGAKDERAGLQKALEYLKAGDCLVVWKRIAPSPIFSKWSATSKNGAFCSKKSLTEG
jgi:DNA invertase Pin-like site-specific DNA recombinase